MNCMTAEITPNSYEVIAPFVPTDSAIAANAEAIEQAQRRSDAFLDAILQERAQRSRCVTIFEI